LKDIELNVEVLDLAGATFGLKVSESNQKNQILNNHESSDLKDMSFLKLGVIV
jgi:hypothetical protein